MLSTADELLQKTQAYWALSSVWNGRLSEEIQTGEALEACSSMLHRTNFERPLSRRLMDLRDEFVEGTGRPPRKDSRTIPFTSIAAEER